MGLPATLVKAIEVPFVITLHDYWYSCANAQLLTNYDNTVCLGPDKLFHNCGRCALARADRAELAWFAPAVAPLMRWRTGRLHPLLQQAQRLIAPSYFIAQVYQQWGIAGDKISVIPHGVEPPPENLSHQPQPERPFRIGYIGGLSWQKGVHCLVEAFQSLPDSELWIAGDTQTDPVYVARLRQLATAQVQFLGKLDREAIWHMLAQLDVVAVPSLWVETFCFVISEAFAARVPVVAFDLGVMSQRIQDGVDGRLVPPGDVPALRDVLFDFLVTPSVLAQLRQGIQPVRTMREHVQEIEALYDTL
jgi:glycosyltransferase involved in cell wall biosynthesis